MAETNNSKQAMWVAIGQFCSFAIGFISPVILSRYFTKGDYGTYKQVMYVYDTLLTVFTLGLPRAYSYFIPRVSKPQSKDVVKKITRFFILLGLAFSCVLFWGAAFIADILRNPDLEDALRWFSPTPLLLLPVMGLDSILASYKKTQFLALYNIVTRIFILLCIITPVLFFNGTYREAIIGFDIASLLTFLLAIYLRNLPTKGIKIEECLITYKEIFSFTLPLVLASFWIMIFHSVNQFFISRYYGNEVFADYSNGFIAFPIIPMIINAVATVLMPQFSGMAKNNKSSEIGVIWMQALSKSIKLIYPIAIFCIVFSELMMTCLYGKSYAASGGFFAIKNIEALFGVIPFYPLLLALGKAREYSHVHLIIAILIIPIEYAIVYCGGSAYLIAITYVACYITKTIMQFSIVQKNTNLSFVELIPMKELLKISIVTLLASYIVKLATSIIELNSLFVMLGLVAGMFAVLYYILCWLFKIEYKDIFVSYISPQKYNWLIKLIP